MIYSSTIIIIIIFNKTCNSNKDRRGSNKDKWGDKEMHHIWETQINRNLNTTHMLSDFWLLGDLTSSYSSLTSLWY